MDRVLQFKQLLYLDEDFPDIDNLLLQMFISPTSLTDVDVHTLASRYSLTPIHMNFEILKFYGSSVLNLLAADIAIHKFGLNIFPGKLNKSIADFVKTLTYFSRELGYCSKIYDIPDTEILNTHNICADTFKALLGMLNYQYSYDRIFDWFIKLTSIIEHLYTLIYKEIMNEYRPSYISTNFPSVNMDDHPILVFKQLLNLDTHFPDIDDLLLQMVISPTTLTNEDMNTLSKRYSLTSIYMNYELLEFYGDSVLSLLVIDIILDKIGLNTPPGKLHKISSEMVKNETLTYFSRELGYCSKIYNISDDQQLDKHNFCADTFEAILGILHYHYKYDSIKQWFMSLTPIMNYLDILISEENMDYYGPTYKWTKMFPFFTVQAQGTPDQILKTAMNTYLRRFPTMKFVQTKIRNDLYKLSLINSNNREVVLANYAPGDSGYDFSQRVLQKLDTLHIIRII